METSRSAIGDLKRAIEHMKGGVIMQMRTSVEGVVQQWYNAIALGADHCLINNELCIYTKEVLASASHLEQKEEQILKSIISRRGTQEEL